MYKGLQQQPTFIYAECSDVREILVTEANKIKKSKINQERKCREMKLRYQIKITPGQGAAAYDFRETPPRLISSSTSIIKRPSSTLVHHNYHEQARSSVSKRERENHVKFSDSGRSSLYEEDPNRRTPLKILCDLAEAKQARDRRTEIEFLEFAKEFAKKCRSRPTDNLLNPLQYESYLRDTPNSNSLHGVSYSKGYNFSLCSKIPFFRSSSVIGLNEDETTAIAGHVVGDLLSFTSNTAR